MRIHSAHGKTRATHHAKWQEFPQTMAASSPGPGRRHPQAGTGIGLLSGSVDARRDPGVKPFSLQPNWGVFCDPHLACHQDVGLGRKREKYSVHPDSLPREKILRNHMTK